VTITIDTIEYDVPIVDIDRSADFLYKFAERTADGKLHSQLIGVYFNYKLKFGDIVDPTEYALLWDKITEPVETHIVVVPDVSGTLTYTAYFSNVKDKLRKDKAAVNYWKNLTINFIATEPERT